MARLSVLCLLLALLSGCGGSEDRSGDRGGSKAQVSLSAVEFAKEFATDPQGAEAKYNRKAVELEGVVDYANPAVFGNCFTLEGFQKSKGREDRSTFSARFGLQKSTKRRSFQGARRCRSLVDSTNSVAASS
jgi:hypothetical protein